MKLFGMISALDRYHEFLAEIEPASDETRRIDSPSIHRKIAGRIVNEGPFYQEFVQFWQVHHLRDEEFDGLSHLCTASIRVETEPYPAFAYLYRKGDFLSLVLEINSDEEWDDEQQR